MLRLKDLREDKDLLQKDIADILKITQQQYSKVELGINQLSYENLIRLGDFYKVSIDYILGRTNKKDT